MGLILSLLGAGGSILTMPILVYLFFIPVVEATSYSLLIVGLTALFGSIEYFRRKSIHIKTAISFGAPSIIGVLIARKYLLPSVPDQFIFGILITKDFIIMIIFSTLMILASVMMLKKDKSFSDQKYTRDKKNYFIIVVEGFIIGGVTGFVGAGGGFIIIPALVLLAGLEMKIAVGTSLIIIAFKSIIGFSIKTFSFDVDTEAIILWALIPFERLEIEKSYNTSSPGFATPSWSKSNVKPSKFATKIKLTISKVIVSPESLILDILIPPEVPSDKKQLGLVPSLNWVLPKESLNGAPAKLPFEFKVPLGLYK